MKKLNEKKLNLASQTIATIAAVHLVQASGGKWRYKSENGCGTFGC